MTEPAVQNQRLRFAARISRIQPSPTLAVLGRAAELIAKGVDVVDFGPGEPDFSTPIGISLAGKQAIDAGKTKYTNTQGCDELRSAIADSYNRRYGISLKCSNIIAGSGGKQELFNFALALVDYGDEVIIPSPYWVSFPDQVLFAGSGEFGVPEFASVTYVQSTWKDGASAPPRHG